MHVAIIGSGSVGRALATGLVYAGHSVTLTACHAEHAEDAAHETGAAAAASNSDAVRDADVVVLAVPARAHAELAEELGEALRGRPVVDVSNVLNADKSGLASERSTAEDLQGMLPDANVVKALNAVFSSRMACPIIDGVPLDGFYAGDDEQAKQTVRALLADLGYRPIDAGPLRMARALEHVGLLMIRLAAAGGWTWKPGWKLLGPGGPEE